MNKCPAGTKQAFNISSVGRQLLKHWLSASQMHNGQGHFSEDEFIFQGKQQLGRLSFYDPGEEGNLICIFFAITHPTLMCIRGFPHARHIIQDVCKGTTFSTLPGFCPGAPSKRSETTTLHSYSAGMKCYWGCPVTFHPPKVIKEVPVTKLEKKYMKMVLAELNNQRGQHFASASCSTSFLHTQHSYYIKSSQQQLTMLLLNSCFMPL